MNVVDRIVTAVLAAVEPALRDHVSRELQNAIAVGFGAGEGLAKAQASRKPAAAKKSAGRPRKQAEDTSVPEPHSQAGQILALLSKGTRSGTELADGTGLTTRQVHSNLQSLRKRHLVVTKGRGQYALANGVSP